MHHIALSTNSLGDSGSNHDLKFGFVGDESQPVCPKPRQIKSVVATELLKPSRCTKHSQSNSIDERFSFLNTFDSKANDGRSESGCTGCSSSCYFGSPPIRTHNPLIRDMHFIHQMELFSPFTRTNLSDEFRFASTPRM